MDTHIRIRGARQHNLKNVNLDIPRNAFTVITGPSGSGKSSLALDTLFAEGQRRYVESLSAYAKQFLERMEKPDVDSVEGISPAVAIEQKNTTRSSRSTVGTATEIHDYLRLLFARVGETFCPICDRHVLPDTVERMADRILALDEGTRFQLTFPLPLGRRAGHAVLVSNLRALGFVRVLANGAPLDLGDAGGTDLGAVEELLVVVDRLVVGGDIRDRLVDSIGTTLREGEGEAVVLVRGPEGRDQRLAFTERFRCPDHPEVGFLDPTPQLFSFNSPFGSCAECTGFGATLEYDEAFIIPNPRKTLAEGAVDPWTMPRYDKERAKLAKFAEGRGLSVHTPWNELPEEFRNSVLQGATGGKGRLRDDRFQGVLPFLRSRESKRYKQYIRVFLRRYQSPQPCRSCGGARLRQEALRIQVAGSTIGTLTALPLKEFLEWVRGLRLEGARREIASTILRELEARSSFLVEIGLGYLTLDRQMRTLSGGESQRISLANSLGSSLVDAIYVLDEPSIGLHPRDTDALLRLLGRLRDVGNTVIVVEHDPQVIAAADHVVELGPGAGEGGGQVVFEGTPGQLACADTGTGRVLSGRTEQPGPPRRRARSEGVLRARNARLHNIQGVDLEIPLGTLTVVTGVSGSGKSTLVHDILFRALERELGEGDTSAKEHLGEVVGRLDSLEGAGALDQVVLVDQSPIGRTPRSNPVTYIKGWDEIRRIFAARPLARERGYEARHFSFNVPGGRCEACKGAGHIEVEMVFMADVYIPCEVCRGRRFRPEVLDVRFLGKSIADVLELTVDEAIRFFLREDRLGQILWQLQQVGLGYLRLGQSATTLSGGEAQRLKIARELSMGAGKRGRTFYLLDEPTTGLSGEDVLKLLEVLHRLVTGGNTVLVIEHNLELIRSADWVIDLGPGAGMEGGRIVAAGTPEELMAHPNSVTGPYLRG